jgi:anti-anti-sigma factor
MKTKGALVATRRRSPITDTIVIGPRLDASCAKRLSRSVGRVLESGLRDCTIDMSGVETADSVGFGALIAALRKLGAVGAYVAVVCANPTVRRLFEVAGITRLVPVVSRLDDARSLRAAARAGAA